ncbi:MAG TPA: 30S ribosomal protein S21, partial [Pseudomonadota bacterium]|nr:30S ribosomal protein S21 [Pseudomonadota bacterium]
MGKPLEVEVRDNLEKAMKILKQKMSKEGILQEVKRRRFYEKPSV